MQNNGRHISWTHITDLYGKANFGSGLNLLPKVKREHSHLNSYSRMRVNLAAQVSICGDDVDTNIIIITLLQVLSSSVASGLEYFDLDETQETKTFVRNFDRFFNKKKYSLT